MGNPAISVIVPAYNGEQTISACLRSLLSQTFSDFEIICFNDGSTDGTEAVIADFVSGHPEKIRSFRHENAGTYQTRRAALSCARGAYVAFVDEDDTVAPDFLALLHAAAASSGAEIAVCAYERVDAGTGRVFSTEMTRFGRRTVAVAPQEGRLLQINVSLWNKLYRRELFNGLPELQSPPTFMEDVFLNFVALTNARTICFEPKALYQYMVRPGSVVQQMDAGKIACTKNALIEFRRRLSETGAIGDFEELLDALAFVHFGISLMLRVARSAPGLKNARARQLDVIRCLDEHFPRWRATKLLNRDRRARFARFVMKIGCFPQFLSMYLAYFRIFNKEVSW
jgi:glycosyltransferase involved in cell wall biosynthesis